MPYTKTFTQSPLESLVALLGPRKSVPLQRVTEKREDVPNRPGVYLIWCAKNGRFYVGSSEGSIRYRLRHHLQYLSNGKHTNKFLQADFTEFGSEYFYAAVLELCSKEVAQKQEQKFINETRACLLGYNVAPVTGGGSGPHSPESKRKIAAANSRRKVSAETKEKIRRSVQATGLTEAQKERRFAATQRLWQDPQFRKKQAAACSTSEAKLRAVAQHAARRRPVPFRLSYKNSGLYEGPDLFEFLKLIGLPYHYHDMKGVISGKRSHIHFFHLPEKPIPEYHLRSPEGEEFVTWNLRQFSKEHGLDDSCARRVCQSILKQHKGWTKA